MAAIGTGIAALPNGPLRSRKWFPEIERISLASGFNRREVYEMVRRRAKAAGLRDRIGCHTFRATP